ncbi:MAG: VWA domain-containing protein [Ktedonobacteraceae bacterium]
MKPLNNYKRGGVRPWSLRFASCCLLLLFVLSACGDQSANTKQNTRGKAQGTQVAPGAAITCTTHSANPVALTMDYGSEKQAWIEDVVADFNSRNIKACDGPITVKATPKGSGTSMQDILNGTSQPDIWSPAGNVWITLINAKWSAQHGSTLIATGANDTPSLVSSPVVIAMWKPQAEALGWPQKAIGWSDIAKLSTDPQGWRAYGHPEFGDFKFGHTHPVYSNSGLDAVIAMNYAATNKQRGLTNEDVANQSTKDFVATVESSVIHYGDSTGFFANKMFSNGPSYLSATVMYESLVIEANSGKKYPNLPFPVVAIYPKEGTFFSDHPFTILQGSWVTPEKKTAALAFRNFLLDAAQQQKALQYGFRPADTRITLAAPFDMAHGVDVNQPRTLLQVPSANVVQSVLDSWQQQRRRVDVMLILDRSGSMNDSIGGTTKLEGAKQGLKEFTNLLSNQDELGLTVFSNQADIVAPVAPLGPQRQTLLKQIDGILVGGNTRLFDTIGEQVQAIKTLPTKHIKSVVVLTDGMDNASQLNLNQLTTQVQAQGENAGNSIKVFTIAYGSDADTKGLTQIANATGGQEYSGTPQNIKAVYNQISQFF